MKPAQIKVALDELGISYAMIAESLTVSPASVSQVINDKCNSRRIALAIAEILNKPIQEVFPHKSQYHGEISCRKNIGRQEVVNQLRDKLSSAGLVETAA